MRNTAHRRAAETLVRVMDPRHVEGGLDFGPVLNALSSMDAKTVEGMRAEIVSLVDAGYPQQAAERLHTFLRPKFRSVTACREAYEAAMTGRAA